MEEGKLFSLISEAPVDNDHGWKKVTYAKKQRKTQAGKTTSGSDAVQSNGSNGIADKNGVFMGLEKHAEERRRKLEEQRANAAIYDDDDDKARARSKKWGDDSDEDSDADLNSKENKAAEVNKKEKVKKVKKPKVTVEEAGKKIDAADLAAFLADVSASYEGQQEVQLMRFADYFGRAFSAVSAAQFPWLKRFRESEISKIADLPVSYITESVYKTSVEWINSRSSEALGDFVLWAFDGILADLATQLSGYKGSKKGGQQATPKSQVAIFLALALVLRQKPDALISQLPKLTENSKYQGQDKLPIIVWMIAQASQGDLAVGLYLWARLALPILGGKAGSNPQSRDLVLQLVERIISAPKARGILLNSAVRKGERLLPPAALDLLLRVTFPATSARVKATERFESIYPVLKEIALAGSTGSKAMKQVALQIQTLSVKAAGEGIPALSQEATSIFIWCLTQNPECYKQWDKIYLDHIEASVAALKKLSEEWKELSSKQSSLETLKETLKSFRQKNEKSLGSGVDASRQTFFKDSDKYAKALLGKLSSGRGCVKSVAFTLVVLAVGVVVVSPNLDAALDWNKWENLVSQYF